MAENFEDFSGFGTRLDLSGQGERIEDQFDFSQGGTLLDFSDEGEAVESPEKPLSFTESFGRGIDVGQSLLGGAVEATGEAFGAEGLTSFGRRMRERNIQEAQAYGQRTGFKDIDSPGRFGQWAKETIGEQIPLMAPSLAGGVAGAAIGSVVPVVGTALGAAIGALVPSLVLGVGEVQSGIKEKDPLAKSPGLAFAGGSAIAALDSVLPGKVGGHLVRVFGREAGEEIAKKTLEKPVKQEWITRTSSGFASGMATEGVTEAMQEAIGEVASSQAAGQKIDWDALGSQMIEAGAAGALLGGSAGGITSAFTRPGVREQSIAATPPPTQEDIDSPIPTGTTQRGKEILQELIGENSASEILEQAGFPSVGSPVTLTAPGGTVSGTVIDAVDDGGWRGAKIRLDDGRVLTETFESLGRIVQTEVNQNVAPAPIENQIPDDIIQQSLPSRASGLKPLADQPEGTVSADTVTAPPVAQEGRVRPAIQEPEIMQSQEAARTGEEGAAAEPTKIIPPLGDMVTEAARWKGAALKVAKTLEGDKRAALKHSKATTKGDLDAYLMRKFGVDESTARDVSNELTRRNMPADMSADVDDFSGEPWAKPTAQITSDKAPARPELPAEISVPFGSIKTNRIGGPLYRETNLSGLDDLIRNGYTEGAPSPTKQFVTDNIDLALGQGENKGVLVQFRGEAVSGQEHKKPGTGELTGREYQTDVVGLDAINQIIIPKNAKLRGLTKTLLNRNFDREILSDGRMLFSRKGVDVGERLDKLRDLPASEPIEGIDSSTKIYRGSGGRPAEELMHQGIPIAGEATYWSLDRRDAERYGANIEERSFDLKNPLVIREDIDWSRLTYNAGWDVDNLFGKPKDEISKKTNDLRNHVVSQGYDGIVVLFDNSSPNDREEKTGNIIKLLRNVFGVPQVIDYREKPKTEKTTKKAESRDERQRNIYNRRIQDIQDVAELKAYAEDLRTALLTDERTGLGSNRAWINRTPKTYIASIDLDSLKWVNDNMGHDAGDRMIEAVGEAFQRTALADDAYHVSGDEFYVQADKEDQIHEAMRIAKEYLAGVEIKGGELSYKGPGFSYGIGKTIKKAEMKLHEDKTGREKSGERSGRGERPKGVVDAAQTPKQKPTTRNIKKTPAARKSKGAERSKPVVTDITGTYKHSKIQGAEATVTKTDKGYRVEWSEDDVQEFRGDTAADRVLKAMEDEGYKLAPEFDGAQFDLSDSESFIDSTDQLEGLTDSEIALAEELLDNGAKISSKGTVRVYHRTSAENAKSIRASGKMKGKEDGLFFTTSPTGTQSEGYGKAVIAMDIPLSKLQLDDVFGDEAHVRIPAKKAGAEVDVSGWVISREGSRGPQFDLTDDGPFYSALLQSVRNAKGAPKKADAEQWKQWLNGRQKNGEFRQAERDWLGVDAWLEGREETTREDLENFVENNQVQIEEVVLGDGRGKTKYESYQLPGGENYRILILKMPTTISPEKLKTLDRLYEERGSLWFNYKPIPAELGKQIAELEAETGLDKSPLYRSVHFEEPNILVHTRLNERADTDGNKILFIEEIQSDLHQEGRKRGYITTDREELIGDRVPNLPFKGTDEWAMLAFRRMVRLAAENNIDRIAWTTGEQQADRFDLSKQISEINYQKFVSGNTEIHAKDKSGKTVFRDTVPDDKVSGHVGKEVAEKIAVSEDTKGTLSGVDLKVGGEGMKGFYDDILPKAVNKWAKKFGGRVDKIKLPIAKLEKPRVGEGDFPYRILRSDGREFNATRDRAGAEAKLAELLERDPGARIEVDEELLAARTLEEQVHSLGITQKMRDAALQGQPMFSLDDAASAPQGRPELMQFDLTEAMQAKYKDVAKELLKRLKELGVGDKISLRLRDRMELWFENKIKQVKGFHNKGLIEIALSGPDPMGTLNHEIIHALRELGLFTEAEWKALENKAKSDSTLMRAMRERYKPLNLSEESIIEEAIANMSTSFFNKKLEAKGFVRTALRKIGKFFEALRNSLRGNGFITADDVFVRVGRGEVGRRAGRAGKDRGERFELGDKILPERRKPTPNFDNPESEARWQEARKGIAGHQTLISRLSERLEYLKQGFTRHFINLPEEPFFSDAREQMRKLEAAPQAAKEQAIRNLKAITNGMNREDLDLFTRKVVLDDLSWEADVEHELPFGFTPRDVARERVKIDAALRNRPDLMNRIRLRNKMSRELADNLVSSGVLSQEQIRNPAYYRHQVLDYARAQVAYAKGPGKKLKTPKWARRMGSKLDINANLLEAEFEWMQKAIMDISSAKTIDWFKKSMYNVRDDVIGKAKAHNKKLVEKIIEKDLKDNGFTKTSGKITSPINEEWLGFRQRIAMGLGKIRQAIEDGELTDIPAEHAVVAKSLTDSEISETSIFPFLAWILDNNLPGSMGAAQAFKAISQRKVWTQSLLGDQYADTSRVDSLVKRFAPEGYKTWQPDEGKLLFTAKTIPEHVLDRMLNKIAEEGAGGVMTMEELKGALDSVKSMLAVGGPKYQMILPEEIADSLNSIRDDIAEGLFDTLLTVPLTWWKRWILINPRRVLKYNLNNISGDLDAVVAGNPKVIKKLPQAIKELYQVMTKGEAPSQRYIDAVDRGVFDSGLSAQEIPDINYLTEFEKIINPPTIREPIRLTLSPLVKVWRKLQQYTTFRENWMRYAAYLDYIDRIEAGESLESIGYGASRKEMVDAILDQKDKAALLARDLVGDYGAISHFGKGIRQKLIPFYSWMEINTKRYWRLGANAWSQGVGQGFRTTGIIGASLGLRTTAYLTLRMAMLYGLVQLWNNLVFGDEEDELNAEDRARLHLILGRDDAGEIRTLRFQGALSDYLGWIGFADAVGVMSEIEKGRADYVELAETIGKAPVNKVLTSVTPLISAPVESLSGYKYWPDVFQPRAIKDKWRNAAQLFSVEHEYDLIFERPSRGYGRSLQETLVYKRDPGENAYNRMMGMSYEWLRKEKGLAGSGSYQTPRSKALYDYRQAKRFGDRGAQRKALLRLEELGVNYKDLGASIRRAHPLGSIPIKDRSTYLKTLTGKERKSLDMAIEWYRETYID